MAFADDHRKRTIYSEQQQQEQQQQHSFSGQATSQPHHPASHHHPQQDHISFAPEPSTHTNNNPSKLVKRNSFKLSKRISSSSLLPSNYSNKKKPSTSSAPTASTSAGTRARRSSSAASNHLRNNSNLRLINNNNRPSEAGTLYRFVFHHPVVMSLKDNIMARKGYWLRNGAILFFGLTIFFFFMLPTSKPNLHEKIPVSPLEQTGSTWPVNITSEHCDVAHPGRPLIQYVLMIDAGSSGSRIHAYKFNYCKATPELESEVFEMLKPGLSSFDDNAQAAAESLDPLLNIALKTVPEFLHKSTPVAVKATAGLRMLGPVKSTRILDAVRHRLETVYPFPIIKEQGVAVMDGGDEGVYAWVTVNYLLRRINSLEKTPTVAIMDLGGASTQIVFEPLTVNGHNVAQGDHRKPMSFNANNYVLFQHSYLGYGLNEANKQINDYVIDNPISSTDIQLSPGEYLHPCMPVNTRTTYTHNDKDVVLIGVSDSANECRRMVQAIFYKEKACSQIPCSFNGVYQPSLTTSFDSDIYAFSYIFDRITPFRSGSDVAIQEITLQELEDLTNRVCVADEDSFKEFDTSAEAKTELGNVAAMCMDLNYIYGLLHHGYGIAKDRKINLTKKIRDYETGWCLGASIAVLEDAWYLGA